jgi:hypothetical protein
VAQPLSNLDYLIGAVKRTPSAPPGEQAARGPSGDVSPSPPSSAMQQADVAFGVTILRELNKADGKLSADQLVDATGIRLQTLFYVLDKLASDYHWIDVDKSDPKGNYRVELRQEGRDYMRELGLQ